MKRHTPKHETAHQLETHMGDPLGQGLFSLARRAKEDEHERYPLAALKLLDNWGLQRHYVPANLGGDLKDFEVLFSLMRTVSQRDLTVSISHAVSFLGSIGVWIAGNYEQKLSLARRLCAGERISLALTERNHGGDLLAIETHAYQEQQDCRRLEGEKWLINGATRNSLITVLARTKPNGGPRGFSLFLFDKNAATPGSFKCLDKVRTLGVRGSDISGIQFLQAELGQSALIGNDGEGFEIVLKGLQLTRLLCGAISLGAGETAFQTVLDFALKRQVYGRTVFQIPQCRQLLVEAWVDLMLCEFLLTAAARSLHFVPSEASVHSAMLKYLVPQILEQTLKQLSVVLGARYYLREEYCFGIFQKMLRDSSLVSLFDGSSVVNLYSLTTQLKALSRCWTDLKHDAPALWPSACQWRLPLPEFQWNDLSLASGGKNCFLELLPSALNAARELAESQYLPAGVARALQQQLEILENSVNTLMKEIASINFGSPHAVSSEAFDKARAYCAIEAAAIALQTWLANRADGPPNFADAQWLVLALARLNGYVGQKTNPCEGIVESLAEQLLENLTENEDTESMILSAA